MAEDRPPAERPVGDDVTELMMWRHREVVHGDPGQSGALRDTLQQQGRTAVVPTEGQTIDLH